MLKTTKGSNYLQFTSSGNYSTCQVASPHLQPTEFICLPETTLHSSWYTQISCDLSHLAQWLATCVTDNSPDNGNQRSCKLLIGHSLSASVSYCVISFIIILTVTELSQVIKTGTLRGATTALKLVDKQKRIRQSSKMREKSEFMAIFKNQKLLYIS